MILERDCDELTWLSQAMHWSCVHVSGSMSTTSASQHTSSSTFEYQNPLIGFLTMQPNVERNIPPVGSALGNKSCPQMLHAATPVISAAKAKKGAWHCQHLGVHMTSIHTMYIRFQDQKSPTRWLVARSRGVGMSRLYLGLSCNGLLIAQGKSRCCNLGI